MITKENFVKIIDATKELDRIVCRLCQALGVNDTEFDKPLSDIIDALCDEIDDVDYIGGDVDWTPETVNYIWAEHPRHASADMLYDYMTKKSREVTW